jgi:malate:Na+ symporter
LAAAILCLFVPSAMIGYGAMPDAALNSITTTFKNANFQYFLSPAWLLDRS